MELKRSAIRKIFFGQTLTHNSQPLHRSSLNVTWAKIFASLSINFPNKPGYKTQTDTQYCDILYHKTFSMALQSEAIICHTLL